jgi:hypothetical protein
MALHSAMTLEALRLTWGVRLINVRKSGPGLLEIHHLEPKRHHHDEWVPRPCAHLFITDTNIVSWSVVFVAIVIAILCLAGYVFAPKGDNQTYSSRDITLPLSLSLTVAWPLLWIG